MPGHAAPIAVILLLQLRVRESAGDVTVVCRDLRDVEVTWDPARHAGANLSLTWRYGGDPRRPCPRYFLSDGVTSGCVLPARRGLRPLEIDVRLGAEPVFHRKGLASAFLKPRPPDNLTLHWLEDAVRVTCPALPHVGLDYVIQHRGPGDADWVASAPAPSCDVTFGGADPRACLSFRARASPREPIYGRDARPSDWSHVTQHSCHAPPTPGFPKLPAACGLLTLVTSLLLLLGLRRLHRVKRALLPWSQTPRAASRGCSSGTAGTSRCAAHFPSLPPVPLPVLPDPLPVLPAHFLSSLTHFRSHQTEFQSSPTHFRSSPANFLSRPQAWIAQDVTPPPKPEASEPADPAEVALVLEHHGKGAEPDPAAGSPGLPRQAPRGGDLVTVGGVTFAMDGGSYMTL